MAVEQLGTARWTRLSTNVSRQLERPENSHPKTWCSASTLGLSLHPRGTSRQTRENARRARTRGMLRIRTREQLGAAVNTTGVVNWGRKVVAPRHGFEPRFTAPKAAVLPLDDRGLITTFSLVYRCPRRARNDSPFKVHMLLKFMWEPILPGGRRGLQNL